MHHKYSNKYTNEQKKGKNIVNKEQTFDELDSKIMRELLTDSRTSLRQISNKLKVSVGTVANRVKNLTFNKVLKYYTAVIDHEKIGYDLSALIELTVAKGKLLEVAEKISKLQNVCAVYDITGSTDTLVIAKFKNRKELNDFVKSLLVMDYVERTNTHVILNTVKEDFRLI